MNQPEFSVIIPAHNEEKYITACLDSVKKASEPHNLRVETIVVLNRCTDKTEAIAVSAGARIVHDDSRNLSRIRNAGANVAGGEILVTIDADSTMSPDMLIEIEKNLLTGKFIGGGVEVYPERRSPGINVTYFLLKVSLFFTGLSGGLYWCYLKDFNAAGKFNENLSFAEDIEFAKRLRLHGKKSGKKFHTIKNAHITTSCRKFDHFGEWFMFTLLLSKTREIREGLKGKNTKFADKYFYDFNTNTGDGLK
ncbi:MAG: hypothetical protein A2314_01095 [Elusimicrobia bacterium RIFOXYB2_FULL_50_12]|nr:MAG: hypothetical protein A2314_01095 [Elusimicrobia bacterium RIFOXYB2_FULL_50_12]